MSTEPTTRSRLALVAVVVELLAAAAIAGIVALAQTEPNGDAVPRWMVVGVLYATPGIVAALGWRHRRRELLLAAALPLLPGSWLAFSGVTLPFLVPATLFAWASLGMPRRHESGPRFVALATGLIVGLIAAAAILALIVLTGSGCWDAGSVSGCGDGLITVAGTIAGLACDGAAIALAVAIARR